jgi:hypothetical protein
MRAVKTWCWDVDGMRVLAVERRGVTRIFSGGT